MPDSTTSQRQNHGPGQAVKSTLTADRGPFSQVPNWIWTSPDLDHAAIRVYGILLTHGNREREAFPGIRRIAEEACMSTNTVQRSLEALELVGAVVITRTLEKDSKERAVNHYHLPWLPSRPVAIIATKVGGGVATIATPGVATIATELDPPSELDTPNPMTPREKGTNSRVAGTNPRAKETNPRATGINPRRALSFAIAEARKDSSVRDPERVGRFRYDEDPAKYEAMADRAELAERVKECRRCGGTGLLHFRIDGTETDREDIDAEVAEPCDHRPALAVAG